MQTSRIELVRLTSDHLPGYHAIWSDRVATRWSPHGPCSTLEDSKEWMSPLLPETNAKGDNYAVLLRTPLAPEIINSRGLAGDEVLVPGGFLGWVGTWRSDPVPEVGLIFHRACWGLGFATEALEAFLKVFWANRPEFELLDAWCDTENIASQNVLKKCRFALVESVTGDYTLPWMVPALRSSLRFQIRRSTISPGGVGKED